MSNSHSHHPLSEGHKNDAVNGERPDRRLVHLAAYDPTWPSQFLRLQLRIQNALDDKVLLLEHVGSTAVPGLSAKPIIDIVLAVADSSHEVAYVDPLEKAGFPLRRREPEWHEHRLFKSSDIKTNLHVFSTGCPEIARMIRFRDRLRHDPPDRMLYENTKLELATRAWESTQDYANAKSAVIQEILNRAQDSR